MLKTESYKKGILLSTVFNVFVKCIAFFNTLIIAYYFGVTIDTDLYFYVFSVVTLIASLFNGMDSSVLLPEGMHLQEKDGIIAGMHFYNFFGYIYLVAGALLFVALFFFSIPIYSTVSAFKSETLINHRYLLLISSAIPMVLILSNYLTTVLTTFKYFTLPLIASGIAQIAGLVTLLFFHTTIGIPAMLTGLLIGYMLNVFLLVLFMSSKLKWQFGFRRIQISKRIKKNLFSIQMGNLATFTFNYGIIVLLSSLGTGIYSAYNYGMQVINIPLIFIVAQTSAVAGIKFNELAAKSMHVELNKIFNESIGILLFFIVPFCFMTWLYTDTIVNFLFLRGGFTIESSEKVVLFLKYLIFLTPCLTINTFISRLMTADKKVSQAFYFQLGFNIIFLLLLLGVTYFYAVNGFIFTMLSTYYFYIGIACIFVFRWIMPFINYKSALKSLGLIFLYNIPFVFICYNAFEIHQPLTGLVLIGTLYYLVIIITNHFIKINKGVDAFFTSILKFFQLKA
jgi:peptidoglycan biosynthesis protein MviN/MurJ (putative lipid II flippase)